MKPTIKDMTKQTITLKATGLHVKGDREEVKYTVIATQDYIPSAFGGPGCGHYRWAIFAFTLEGRKGALVEANQTYMGPPEGKITKATLIFLLERYVERER